MRALFWFRKGLRLHDNPALAAALAGSPTHLYPVYVLDPLHGAAGSGASANRAHFLLESLQDLDQSLRALGSRLVVLRGDPSVELPRAMQQWRIDRLAYEMETDEGWSTPYAKARDERICALAAEANVEVVTRWGHTLCDLDALLARHPGGKPTKVYSAFLGHLERQLAAEPIALVDAPARLPPHGELAAADALGVPSVAELGLAPRSSAVILRGGETEALARMEAHLKRGAWVAKFEKPSTSPTEMDAFAPQTRATTCLSPYLTLGCLSARTFHLRLAAVYRAHPVHAKPPVSLHGQLYVGWPFVCFAGAPGDSVTAAAHSPQVLARVLLCRGARHAQLWPDGGQSRLPTGAMGRRRRAARGLARRAHGVPDRTGIDASRSQFP
jgi:cryptochrome